MTAENTIMAEAQSRESFAVTLDYGLWRGFDVLVEPRTVTHPPRHFRDYAGALGFAAELSRVTGWPLADRAELDGRRPA